MTETQKTNTQNYNDILMVLLKTYSNKIENGKTIIAIWKDKAHLEQWQKLNAPIDNNARVAIVPTRFLPMLNVDNIENVIVAGIALGTENDYSDVVLLHYITVKKNN
jgi:hypothetical protein